MSIEAIIETFHILLRNDGERVKRVDKLLEAGSNRVYFRIYTEQESYIGTYSDNINENETFFYFAEHFKNQKLVPQIQSIAENRKIYIQEDFGSTSLFHLLQKEGYSEKVYNFYKKALKKLAFMQIKGHENLDYTKCFSARKFDRQTIIADLYYFKFCFVDALKIPYDKQKLADDFDTFIDYLEQAEHQYFMFRDFQSRNIQIYKNEPYFIDFQGGMQGAVHYDIASLLWQTRANLPVEWREKLLEEYISFANEQLTNPIQKERFKKEYYGYILIRLIQVLGAYGFRGLFEKKQTFVTSIAPTLDSIKWFLEQKSLDIQVPELMHLLQKMTTNDIKNKFILKKETKLNVKVGSFSYKKGIPEDASGNGGGFVFDCRGILNPGRMDQYKTKTGRDPEVMEYLETQTRMPEFIQYIFDVVDITIEDYMERGFENLQIMFGCTGGQHRSVYAADAMAKHLEEKYGIKTEPFHREQEAKNWINKMY